ncbi:unnamed protein product [Effrenium voratum]|uniref:CID domain-containing protein n=1 Tax=Effrenium voratum TaxID=2562239 RepID=A0AA36JIW6_9DINO|nr:unnamed protein product [Effrenium voratum]CAJ1425191.1 unnamed protein product [Effrenium voratum]
MAPGVPVTPMPTGLEGFRLAIQDLETKSGSKIKNLTELAQQLYSNSAAIVQAVAEEIQSASPERIQPQLLVVDSILKKVGKDYKVHFAEHLPTLLRVAFDKSDEEGRGWLKRMVEESWHKHELLPMGVFENLFSIFQPQAAASTMAAPMPQAMPQPQAPFSPVPPPPAGAPPGPSSPTQVPESDEQVERRLRILTKIIERKPPRPDELQEIMKVPEIRKAIAMQQKNQRQEATALLSQFKQELERRHKEIAGKDPRLAAAGAARPADPRMERKPQDPREAKVSTAKDPRPMDPRARQEAPAAEPPKKRVKTEAEAEVTTVLSDDEVEVPDEDMPLVPTRHFLQGMPSLGFSETWLRQFMSQMPRNRSKERERVPVGRKVLGASGDQMVYVDAISPGEMLLLMQFVFMLEDKLRATGRSVDLAQRVSHTFSFLQVDLAVDVMLKWVFDGLPFQCNTTGLRFSTREKLRRHNEGLKRRKEQRQMNAEARGWMDPIPDWVGNRDLVVGPALFGPNREVRAVPEPVAKPDAEVESHWEVPFDPRRSVCPISGERFERSWSRSLNDWAFTGAVAAEMHAMKQVKFPPGSNFGPHGLSETAVILKKSCFANTSLSGRLDALQECCDPEGIKSVPRPAQAASSAPSTQKEDPELALLQRAPARNFF